MLQIGIVGLPNVGKSTLFNLLAGKKQADAQNFPFCTIEPNEAVVNVPDVRLAELAKIVQPERTVPAAIKFVDIAGLVAGASQGEGLGNQFLAHIRECDAILQVVRFFENDKIIHVDGTVNPDRDAATIMTELCLADILSLEKQRTKLEKKARAQDKEAAAQLTVIDKILPSLENGTGARAANLTAEERELARPFFLLTGKPFFFVANVDEDKIGAQHAVAGKPAITICAKFEEELLELDAAARAEFMAEAGVTESGLDKIIRTGYELLGLISFFTAGVQEVRAWTINRGDKAPRAAGTIHTDFEKKFIMAETVHFPDFVKNGGWQGARERGLSRQEGKEYEVQDGDVLLFRHG